MAKKIIDMVRAKSQSMYGNPGEARANTELAIAAMKNGIESSEWKAYMKQFVEKDSAGDPLDSKQLDRLLATDTTANDFDMDRRRAYLIGNAPCMEGTPTNLPVTVDTIDDGI